MVAHQRRRQTGDGSQLGPPGAANQDLAHAGSLGQEPRRGKPPCADDLDIADRLRFAGPVPLWFGLALLALLHLGGGALAENSRQAPATSHAPAPAADDEEAPADAASRTRRRPTTRATEGDDLPSQPPTEQPFLSRYGPAPIEGPGLRLPEPLTRIYLDTAYARTDDLSGLPLIAGSAHNYRFAFGAARAWQHLALEGEIAFGNITTIDVTQVPGGVPVDVDKHQTATSVGDTRVGATWRVPLTDDGAIVGAASLRLRLPTHTVVFQFHLVDMVTLGRYLFPYYFHIEPALILGGTFGRFSFVVNEGLLLMTGPDGNFQNLHITVPNLLFWSAHYAVVFSPLPLLALSADLATDVQINRVTVMDFEKVNGVFAASLDVGLQVHIDQFRIDLIGRRGLNKDAELFGVLQYAGTQSLTLRVSYIF